MLETLPMVAMLIGLVFYVVLGGADFGAAIWQVLAGRGPHAHEIREHAHEQMAPVWEANHVWLIFVLTVMWTAYPTAFGSMASTLSVPLFLAAIGIILRGAAYALRTASSRREQVHLIDRVSAVSSVLAPFTLGTAVGGIASGRVPVGNAAGSLWSSWLNATSIAIGVLSVATSAYLAAVFLAADAVRRSEPDLEREFRRRAIATGLVAGVLALAGLVVLRFDARDLFDELFSGAALAAVIASVLAGAGTLALLAHRGGSEPARYAAAVAVAAIVAGWALAQEPEVLPGLTLERAAAPHDTLVAVLIAIAGGALILFPSLLLLFRLALGGRLGSGSADEPAGPIAARTRVLRASRPGLAVRLAGGCLIAGFGLLNVAEAEWAHLVGVAALAAFVILGCAAVLPGLLSD